MTLDGVRWSVLQLHAAACALLVRAALRAGSLPLAVRLARFAGSLCRSQATTDDCVEAGGAAVARLAHATCLYRALTTFALLVRRQPLAQFHVGTAASGSRSMHAWVTVAGQALDAEARHYVTLWTASAER